MESDGITILDAVYLFLLVALTALNVLIRWQVKREGASTRKVTEDCVRSIAPPALRVPGTAALERMERDEWDALVASHAPTAASDDDETPPTA